MKKPIFIFICGDMASGKSTISRKILKEFPKLNYVNSDLIRDYFRDNYSYYNDLDNSYPNTKAQKLNTVINPLREDILHLFLNAQQSILFNKSGLTASDRKYFLDLVPNKEYIKILIQTQISEEELQNRIRQRDIMDLHSNNWEKFHNELRKDLYEPVTQEESEYILTYNQNNLEDIIEIIRKYI